MAGRKTRGQGYRYEIKIRDELRANNFKVDRIPLSGAATEKGDLRMEIPGTRFSDHPLAAKFKYIECKRKSLELPFLWELFTIKYNREEVYVRDNNSAKSTRNCYRLNKPLQCTFKLKDKYIRISNSPLITNLNDNYITEEVDFSVDPKAKLHPVKRLSKFESLMGPCDILVVGGCGLKANVWIEFKNENSEASANSGAQVSDNSNG